MKTERNILVSTEKLKKNKKKCSDFQEWALVKLALQGLALFQSRHTESLSAGCLKDCEKQGPISEPSELRPCPYGHSQCNCAHSMDAQWAVCSACKLYSQTSCSPGCSYWQEHTLINTSICRQQQICHTNTIPVTLIN